MRTFRKLDCMEKINKICNTESIVVTKNFPKHELYGSDRYNCTDRALSIPSNIAEGYGRRLEQRIYEDFYKSPWARLFELQTQIIRCASV